MSCETNTVAEAFDKRGRAALEPTRQVGTRFQKAVFLSLAAIFFVLGALGALLPGLPATPFLLLTSYFLVRSSPRLNAVLLRSRFFGPILVDWQVHGGIRQHVRLKAIVAVVLAVTITLVLCRYSLWLSLVIILLASMGIAVIVTLPTAKPDR